MCTRFCGGRRKKGNEVVTKHTHTPTHTYLLVMGLGMEERLWYAFHCGRRPDQLRRYIVWLPHRRRSINRFSFTIYSCALLMACFAEHTQREITKAIRDWVWGWEGFHIKTWTHLLGTKGFQFGVIEEFAFS